jgi:hypothetical protein
VFSAYRAQMPIDVLGEPLPSANARTSRQAQAKAEPRAEPRRRARKLA